MVGALRLHRTTALRLLRARVDRLAGRFSQSEERLFVSPALHDSLEADSKEMPDVASRRPNHQQEPFRRRLSFVSARLDGALRGMPHGYREPRQLEDDLELLHESSSSGRVAAGALAGLICQVRTFGFHLAALDVRLLAHDLRSAIERLAVGFAAAGEEERANRLATVLESGPGETPESVRRDRDWPARVRTAGARERHHLHGRGSVGRSGRTRADAPGRIGVGELPTLPLVPLFETVADLDRAHTTMSALCDDPMYAAQLAACSHRQEIMVGYSDSAKNGAFLPANGSCTRPRSTAR